MKICVYGLWHLGAVTAACIADAGFDTVALDDDRATIANLARGIPPLYEPGLPELTARGLASGKLSFTQDKAEAVSAADVVWITFDTPVDDDDRADVNFVQNAVGGILPHVKDGTAILISSQLPVGSVAALEGRFQKLGTGKTVRFAYSPENLRLGKAIDIFKNPGRIIVGVRDDPTRRKLEPLVGKLCSNVIWTRVESAEMTKHALNAFLATCVTFINEIASTCERVGADAAEVEEALKSEPRIGRQAYLRPGAAFAGGTLARDVQFLNAIAGRSGLKQPLLEGVLSSNREHRKWPFRRLCEELLDLKDKRIAVLGLSYKPGTDAIRRSLSVELIRDLLNAGATVAAFDPKVNALPADLAAVRLASSIAAALEGSEAAVIATEWPEFKALSPGDIVKTMYRPLVLDQNRFLDPAFMRASELRYLTVGKP